MPDLVDSEGEDIDEPVVGEVSKDGVAPVPEGGAHRQARKPWAHGTSVLAEGG